MTLNPNLDSTDRQRGVTRLAKAIVRTARDHRRGFDAKDGQRAGFSEAEVTAFWDDAMIEARRIEPGIDDMTVQS